MALLKFQCLNFSLDSTHIYELNYGKHFSGSILSVLANKVYKAL